MTNAVFYSVCPFGTGTIETGAGTIEITSGVATLSVAQTGNIGAGVCIEYNSVECWIAPNRIAFTSGGTTELLTGTKIAGGTSGATGIVRAIEVNSGTWAGGDAAGWIYFEATTGTWGSSEQINRTKPTDSSNIATTNGSLEGNIGNGNTEFVVKNATGGAASNQTATNVTSVHHEWASLADFETYFTDGSHIGNVSLVTADVVAYACCYYDHDVQAADTNRMYIDFGTTGVNNYLQIYTPIGGAESINSQRHDGKYNTDKYRLVVPNDCNIKVSVGDFRIVGLQIYVSSTSSSDDHGMNFTGNTAEANYEVSNCVIRGYASNSQSWHCGIQFYASGTGSSTAKIFGNVIYDFVGSASAHGLECDDTDFEYDIYNNTIYNCNSGISWGSGTVVIKNCAVFNNSDDYTGTMTVTYSASDDSQTGTGNIQWTGGSTDWGNVFTDYANGDFSLKDFSGTGAIIEQGTPLLSEGVWRDIIGTERDTTTPDIGAFEYVSAGPSVSIPIIMHHLRQQGIA